jgi:hypothetical protein
MRGAVRANGSRLRFEFAYQQDCGALFVGVVLDYWSHFRGEEKRVVPEKVLAMSPGSFKEKCP